MNWSVKKIEKAPKCLLGESPKWFESLKILVYIDIFSCKLFTYSLIDEEVFEMQFTQSIGFAIPSSNLSPDQILLLVGLEDQVVEVEVKSKSILRKIVMVPDKFFQKWRRFNDGECNPDGILFSGFLYPYWVKNDNLQANYFQVDVYRESSVLREVILPTGVYLPNGSAWLNSSTFFLVDSKIGEIQRIVLDMEFLSKPELDVIYALEQKCIYKLPENELAEGKLLDGMTIDSTDHLWVALSGASCLLEIDSSSGQELRRVPLPCKYPVACVFGMSMTNLPLDRLIFLSLDRRKQSGILVRNLEEQR